MPIAALRLCAGGCGARVTSGRCQACALTEAHQRRRSETWRHATGATGETIDVYQTARWKRLRAEVLEDAHYLCQCEDCARWPVPMVANTVDHLVPHRGDARLFWDRENLRAMAPECHSRKTANEVNTTRAGRGSQISGGEAV